MSVMLLLSLVAPLCATLIAAIATVKIVRIVCQCALAITRIVQRETTKRETVRANRDIAMVEVAHGENTKISVDSKTATTLRESVTDATAALTAIAKQKLPTPKGVRALRAGKNDD